MIFRLARYVLIFLFPVSCLAAPKKNERPSVNKGAYGWVTPEHKNQLGYLSLAMGGSYSLISLGAAYGYTILPNEFNGLLCVGALLSGIVGNWGHENATYHMHAAHVLANDKNLNHIININKKKLNKAITADRLKTTVYTACWNTIEKVKKLPKCIGNNDAIERHFDFAAKFFVGGSFSMMMSIMANPLGSLVVKTMSATTWGVLLPGASLPIAALSINMAAAYGAYKAVLFLNGSYDTPSASPKKK